MSDRRDTVIGPHPMMAPMNRLFTPGELAALECIRCLYVSLIRKGAVDPLLAGELCARAMAAVEEGGTAPEMLARWVAIQTMAETVLNPDAWRPQPAPLLPGLPQGGGEGAPATLPWSQPGRPPSEES